MKKDRGFTMIELLLVIAILGVLAVVVLIALNPLQQIARARDSGRISGVTQLGHAIEAYGTTNSGIYPPVTNWMTTLRDAGEIASLPSNIPYTVISVGCSTNAQNGYCYSLNPVVGSVEWTVYSRLESNTHTSRCTAVGGGNPYAVYSNLAGRGGVSCCASEPTTANFSEIPGANPGANCAGFLP